LATAIYTLSLHDALPISVKFPISRFRQQSVSFIELLYLAMTTAHRAVMIVVLLATGGDLAGQGTLSRNADYVKYIDSILAVKDRSEEHTSELQSRGHLVC